MLANMRALFYLTATCLVLSVSVSTAQTVKLDSIKAGWGNLDYAIPNSPAFNILGTEPGDILKPTSVRAVAVSVGNYFMSNGGVIPKALAVEISPLLLNGKQSLQDYNDHLFWSRFRLSFGTAQQNSGGYKVAQGVKFTIIDKSDLRANKVFLENLATFAMGTSVSVNAVLKKYADENPVHPYLFYRNKFETDTAFKKLIMSKIKTIVVNDKSINADTIGKYRDLIKKQLWNAPIVEIGIASLQSSKDSLMNNLRFSKVGFWGTAALPVFKTDGQFLIGIKAGLRDSLVWKSELSLGSRLYYGNNNTRGFLQADYQHIDNGNQYVLGMGCLFNVTNGVWAQAGFNIIIKDGKASYAPGINIGFVTPEKKHL